MSPETCSDTGQHKNGHKCRGPRPQTTFRHCCVVMVSHLFHNQEEVFLWCPWIMMVRLMDSQCAHSGPVFGVLLLHVNDLIIKTELPASCHGSFRRRQHAADAVKTGHISILSRRTEGQHTHFIFSRPWMEGGRDRGRGQDGRMDGWMERWTDTPDGGSMLLSLGTNLFAHFFPWRSTHFRPSNKTFAVNYGNALSCAEKDGKRHFSKRQTATAYHRQAPASTISPQPNTLVVQRSVLC